MFLLGDNFDLGLNISEFLVIILELVLNLLELTLTCLQVSLKLICILLGLSHFLHELVFSFDEVQLLFLFLIDCLLLQRSILRFKAGHLLIEELSFFLSILNESIILVPVGDHLC